MRVSLQFRWTLLLLLSASYVIVSYFPTLLNSFCWDDRAFVLENPLIRDLSWSGLGRIFTDLRSGYYMPLSILSYAVEYHFFGTEPVFFHTTNFVLHLANCGLVLWILWRLVPDRPTAVLAALLFAVHPAKVEAVAWIAARKDLLCAFFFFLSIIFYQGGKRAWTLFFFILSLMSKTMTVTLPFILILLDRHKKRPFSKKVGWERALFFSVSICFGSLTVYTQRTIGALGPETPLVPWNVLMTLVQSLAFYVYKTLLPLGLSCLYPTEITLGSEIPKLAAIALFSFMAWRLLDKEAKRLFVFSVTFFLVTLLPILRFVPLGLMVVADRYTYIPSIGFALAAALLLRAAASRLAVRPLSRMTALALVSCLLAWLSFTTYQRCFVWANEDTLWADAIKKYPAMSAPYVNHAVHLNRFGKYKAAIQDLDRAIALDPASAEAYNNRAYGRLYSGDKEGALADIQKALVIKPGFADAYVNWANLELSNGKPDQAALKFAEAIRLAPNDPQIIYQRAMVFIYQNDLEGAIRDFDRYLLLKPDSVEALNNRGCLFLQQKNYSRASEDFKRALKIRPDYEKAKENLKAVP